MTTSPLLAPLKPGSKAILFGANGSGKSTLAIGLLTWTYKAYPDSRIVIIDLKRRYFPNGKNVLFPAGLDARLVGRRIGVPTGGVLIDGEPSLLQRRKRIWVVQGLYGAIRLMRWLYDNADARTPTYLFCDETNKLMDGAIAKADYQTLLSEGREINVGGVHIHQRPRNLSRSLITEIERIYIGHLRHVDDIKYLRDSLAIDLPLSPLPMFSWVGVDTVTGETLSFRTELDR